MGELRRHARWGSPHSVVRRREEGVHSWWVWDLPICGIVLLDGAGHHRLKKKKFTVRVSSKTHWQARKSEDKLKGANNVQQNGKRENSARAEELVAIFFLLWRMTSSFVMSHSPFRITLPYLVILFPNFPLKWWITCRLHVLAAHIARGLCLFPAMPCLARSSICTPILRSYRIFTSASFTPWARRSRQVWAGFCSVCVAYMEKNPVSVRPSSADYFI